MLLVGGGSASAPRGVDEEFVEEWSEEDEEEEDEGQGEGEGEEVDNEMDVETREESVTDAMEEIGTRSDKDASSGAPADDHSITVETHEHKDRKALSEPTVDTAVLKVEEMKDSIVAMEEDEEDERYADIRRKAKRSLVVSQVS